MRNKNTANIINHVGLVLDASYSMTRHQRKLIAVADGQIRHLADRSKEMGQETRISVWTFSDNGTTECVVWDMDVLRLPSIAELYDIGVRTALVDASLQAISDLRETPERYGDHSFLLYVLTDGQENDSTAYGPDLRTAILRLPDNWTVGALVPDLAGLAEAKRFGFPPGNIERWDTDSVDGVTEAGARIRQATDSYMTGRAQGVRSTTGLFSTGVDAVNDRTVRNSGLVPLTKGSYDLRRVDERLPIKEFVEDVIHIRRYVVGQGFYQLSKPELVQAGKQVAIVSKEDSTVYVGESARRIVGLDAQDVRVRPDVNPLYDVFVQSTSTNRKLIPGTRFLYLR